MTQITSTCKNCDEPFAHRHDRPVQFCSMVCRKEYGRPSRDCLACGVTFTYKRSLDKKYCSVACTPGRPRDESKYVTKNCPGCHRDFEVPTWRDVEHCSRECWGKASDVEAICPVCGEIFIYKRSWPRIHCSRACYGKASYQGGAVYYGGNWAVQRSLAIVRDGGCVDCGATEDLHVHHILSRRSFGDDWRAANQLDNLVTVCPPHHLVRHGGQYHKVSLPER